MSNPFIPMEPEVDEEEETTHAAFVHHPYNASFSFAATSWQLRKNLTETFNQHINKDEKKPSSKQSNVRDGAINASSVSDKIAQYEKKSSNSSTTATAAITKKSASTLSGKPPRQPMPSSQQTLLSNNDASESDQKRCVSVYLRVRPPKEGMVNTIEILPDNPPTKVRTHAPQRSNAAKMNRDSSSNSLQSEIPTVVREFDFQQVFGPETKNGDLYSSVVAPMVGRMFPEQSGDVNKEPESGLLFAYGATNAGKTYSILGKIPTGKKDFETVDQKHFGIVPRAFQDILERIEHCKTKEPNQCFDLYLSYFEIYNENIYDLLEEKATNHPILREPLKLRESRKQTFIRGLVKRQIRNVADGLRLTRQANSKRHTSSNNLNNDSSRSHCVCQLQIIKRQTNAPACEASVASSGYNTDEEASQISLQKPTTLWIVDLAGSERSKRTNVGLLRQKEASLINKSLMNLMRCMSIMRDNQSVSTSSQIIPFRENKLTHLFMPIFTGRTASNVSMIVNVNPSAPDFDETNHVLSYASQAKMVQISEGNHVATKGSQNGAEEYGYDGRPIKKTKSTTSKLASLVKKLSPKRLVKSRTKGNIARTKVNDSSVDRKRKQVQQPARVPSFSASSTNSTGSQNIPKTKRMRVVNPTATNHLKKSSSEHSLSENDVKSLKLALSVARAELEIVQSEKSSLADEMTQMEAKIRQDVAEEMEEQIENTKRHYSDIIEKMRSQSRESISVFEKKTREEKATAQVDLLLFKVEECEEEMKRQTEAHEEELSTLRKKHDEELATKQAEITQLREQLAKTHQTTSGNDDNIVEQQREKILAQEKELEELKKSKLDVIAEYEKLLASEEEVDEDDDHDSVDDDDDDDDDEDEEDNERKSDSNDENNGLDAAEVGPRRPQPRYMTRNRSLQKGKVSKGPRRPLSSISANNRLK